MQQSIFLIVAYDVVSNRRRNRLVKVLKDYGIRVNYSVFECEISKKRVKELRERVDAEIDCREDRILFYTLCRSCQTKKEYIGCQSQSAAVPVIII
jgi:CRISPR-associated protein Cas2